MLETFVQKGEAVIVQSDKSFDIRYSIAKDHAKLFPEIIVFSKDKILIDDVRDFTYEFQKETSGTVHGVRKLAVIICDEIAQPAQHALLKVLEDMSPESCILIYTHTHSVFLSTVLSRVVLKYEEAEEVVKDWNIHSKTVAERFDMIKKLMKEYDDEKVSKQDIISIVASIQESDKKKGEHGEIYTRAMSMLKQPSVSIKYVLEYVCALV